MEYVTRFELNTILNRWTENQKYAWDQQMSKRTGVQSYYIHVGFQFNIFPKPILSSMYNHIKIDTKGVGRYSNINPSVYKLDTLG